MMSSGVFQQEGNTTSFYLNDRSVEDRPPVDPQLPGHGTPGSMCGENILIGCESCGKTHDVKSSCMKRECPECWRKWAHKLAIKSSMRMWSGGLFKMKGRRGFRLLHTVISFPHDTLGSLRTKARKIAKEHGIVGGLIIYHPFRQDDEHNFIPDGYTHFHVIGLAPGNVTPGGKNSDYIFKVIRDAKRGDYKGFRKPKDISACIYYLLTHCGIMEGSHSLTWFGALSYNSFSLEVWEKHFPELHEYLKPKPRQCPHCGSDDTYPIFGWEYEYMMPDAMTVWAPRNVPPLEYFKEET